MSKVRILLAASVATIGLASAPAMAQEEGSSGPMVSKEEAKAPFGSPIATGDGWTLDPMLDLRLRYEMVDQDTINLDADALTLRARAGLEVKAPGGFSALAEFEGTGALIDDYNDTIAFNGVEPYSVVADPENVELNRLQLGYKNDYVGITLGRQRIVLGDSRWVGNVGWRQNEQTFDAIRVTSDALGPVTLDFTYSESQRTIFGNDARFRTAFDGDFIFGNAGVALGPVDVTAFTYLLNYDSNEPVADTQTYGFVASTALPIFDDFKLNLKGSYAVQKDYQDNPANFSVDYIAGEAGVTLYGFGVTAGYEELGADNSGNRLQTPMATLHKFNGTADIFLNTPPAGLEDYYITVGRKFPGVKLLPGLNAAVTYHEFDSEEGSIDYGSEWDAQLGFKIMGLGALVKYANYDADLFGTDTEKLWVQLGYSF